VLAALAVSLISLLALVVIGLGGDGQLPARIVLALGVGGGLVLWRWRPDVGLVAWVLAVLAAALWFAALPARHDREWMLEQSRLPRVTLADDHFTIADQRAFRWSGDEPVPRWTTQTYRFADIEGADLGISRFSSVAPVAHSFVSVRFTDGEVLAISVEVRKEPHERFSPLWGLLKRYERWVVLADELDVVGVRALQLGERVELHPLQVSPSDVERFLRAVLDDARAIEAQPVWYHTLFASCSTSLARHLRTMGVVPLDPRLALPGMADELAHELGWLGDAPLAELRERHRVDDDARAWSGEGSFSAAIRSGAAEQ
jgi:hypothetical protein